MCLSESKMLVKPFSSSASQRTTGVMKRGQLKTCQEQFSMIYSKRQRWIFAANSQSCSAQNLPVHLQWSFSKRPEWSETSFFIRTKCSCVCMHTKSVVACDAAHSVSCTKSKCLNAVLQRNSESLSFNWKRCCFPVYLHLIVFCLSWRQWWRHICVTYQATYSSASKQILFDIK